MTTTKATFGLRDRNDDIPNIIASRDDVEQSYTDDGINHHNHQRQTMSSTYQSSSRRYPLPPSKPRYIDYLHHHIKKLKNIAKYSRLARVAFHLILGGMILYSLINCIDSKRKMIRQRDIPSKSTVVENIEDIISSNGKTKSYQMFSNANSYSWENDLPGIDDLMDIMNKSSQMFKAEYSSMSQYQIRKF